MGESRRQILQMLQEGKISAAEASELLHSLDLDEPPTSVPQTIEGDDNVLIGEVISPPEPPDMGRYRRFWQVPFFVALGAMLAIGLVLRSLYLSSDGAITVSFVCVWTIFLFTAILTALAFYSRQAAWLHVRVKQREGRRFAISLPLPLGLATWGLNFARGFATGDAEERLEMAAEFLTVARDSLKSSSADPLFINIDDEDGDRVEVYLG